MPRLAFAWASLLAPGTLAVIVVVGIALLGVAWFGLKFWLASTRPADIKEIQTPTLDRLNQRALESMALDAEQDDEEAPEGLKDAADDPGASAP